MAEDSSIAATPASAEGVISKTYHEVTQPFIDLWHAPRALWGVNLAYTDWMYAYEALALCAKPAIISYRFKEFPYAHL